jgi:hydrogenase nickel incorporation protein HypB
MKESRPAGEVRQEGGITVVLLQERILGENARYAQANRALLRSRHTYALNLISSPGAGKTTLLVETLRALECEIPCAVIEGDQQTTNDARRIAETGVPVVQINTSSACHLNAAQVECALKELGGARARLLFIENVGNLICPTAYDLGEEEKVVLLSVTEGEDKPLKYPAAFSLARLMLLTKIDILPHLRFDASACKRNALSVNPDLEIMEVSAYTSRGLEAWLTYLRRRAREAGGEAL